MSLALGFMFLHGLVAVAFTGIILVVFVVKDSMRIPLLMSTYTLYTRMADTSPSAN